MGQTRWPKIQRGAHRCQFGVVAREVQGDSANSTNRLLAEPLRVCCRTVEVGGCFEEFETAIGCRIARPV
jgi:hypothetical protein